MRASRRLAGSQRQPLTNGTRFGAPLRCLLCARRPFALVYPLRCLARGLVVSWRCTVQFRKATPPRVSCRLEGEKKQPGARAKTWTEDQEKKRQENTATRSLEARLGAPHAGDLQASRLGWTCQHLGVSAAAAAAVLWGRAVSESPGSRHTGWAPDHMARVGGGALSCTAGSRSASGRPALLRNTHTHTHTHTRAHTTWAAQDIHTHARHTQTQTQMRRGTQARGEARMHAHAQTQAHRHTHKQTRESTRSITNAAGKHAHASASRSSAREMIRAAMSSTSAGSWGACASRTNRAEAWSLRA